MAYVYEGGAPGTLGGMGEAVEGITTFTQYQGDAAAAYLPTPSEVNVTVFHSQDAPEPNSTADEANQVGVSVLFPAQVSLTNKPVTFLSDDMLDFKFIDVVVKTYALTGVATWASGTSYDGEVKEHILDVLSINQLYSGASKAFDNLRFCMPNVDGLSVFYISVFMRYDYDLLKEKLGLLSSAPLTAIPQGQPLEVTVYSDGAYKSDIIQEYAIADVDSIASPFSTVFANTSANIKALNDEKIRQYNKSAATNFITLPEVFPTGLKTGGDETVIQGFSVVNFFDRTAFLKSHSNFKLFFDRMNSTEKAQSLGGSQLTNIKLELLNSGGESLSYEYPKPAGLDTQKMENRWGVEKINISVGTAKQMIAFNIPSETLFPEYKLKYSFKMKDGIRNILKSYGENLKEDIGKLEQLLNFYAQTKLVYFGRTATDVTMSPVKTEGATSTDFNHYHSYTLDESGNGFTEYAQSPNNPNIKHRHAVINFVVQEAASECYPDCIDQYGFPGIPSHQHQINKQDALVQGNLSQPSDIYAVKNLDLNVGSLERLLEILFSQEETTVFGTLETVKLFQTAQGVAVKNFIDLVAKDRNSVSPEKDVYRLLELYRKVITHYSLLGIEIEPRYSDTEQSPMSHSVAGQYLTYEKLYAGLFEFNSNLKGYAVVNLPTDAGAANFSVLKKTRASFKAEVKKDAQKYLTDIAVQGALNTPPSQAAALGNLGYITQGELEVPISDSLYTFLTPRAYINNRGFLLDNQRNSSDSAYFNKHHNLGRVLEMLTDNSPFALTGESVRDFLEVYESITIFKKTSHFKAKEKEAIKDANIGEKIEYDSSLAEIFEGPLDTDDIVYFLASIYLAKYLPSTTIAEEIKQQFFLEDVGERVPLANQLLVFANPSGLNSMVVDFVPQSTSFLKPDGEKAGVAGGAVYDVSNNFINVENYPFFFNNFLNLFRIEVLQDFSDGFIASPNWAPLSSQHILATDTSLVCRVVRASDVDKRLNHPIYNRIFIIE